LINRRLLRVLQLLREPAWARWSDALRSTRSAYSRHNDLQATSYSHLFVSWWFFPPSCLFRIAAVLSKFGSVQWSCLSWTGQRIEDWNCNQDCLSCYSTSSRDNLCSPMANGQLLEDMFASRVCLLLSYSAPSRRSGPFS
jgi:hypothetical protein